MDDLRVYRLANFLIRNYGTAAPREAARRADELQAKGDSSRNRLWLNVHAATRRLLGDTYAGKTLPSKVSSPIPRRTQDGS